MGFAWSPSKVAMAERAALKGLSPTGIAHLVGAPSATVVARKLRQINWPPLKTEVQVSPGPTARIWRPAPARPAPPLPADAPSGSRGGEWIEGAAVRDLRARGVSWQHIAAQLGRNELSLRKTYDAGFDGSLLPTRPPAAPPAAKAPPGLSLPEILGHVRGQTADDMAARIGVAVEMLRHRLNGYRVTGLVDHDSRRPYCWTLTEAGRETLARAQRAREAV